MLNKKQSSRLWLGMLSLLTVVLLSGFLSTSTVYAASPVKVDTVGGPTKLTVKLQNKSVQDSVAMSAFKISVTDTLGTVYGRKDTVWVTFTNGKFLFAKSGPYKVTKGSGGMTVDSARVSADGTRLFIAIAGDSLNTDTLSIPGVYVKAVAGTALSDSSTVDNLTYTLGGGATTNAGTNNFVLLPGSIWKSTITAGPTTPVQAGSAISVTLSFTDLFNNVPNDSTTSVSVTPILSKGGSPNGTLTGQTTITHSVILPGTDTYEWTALKYTRAEDIKLIFTTGGGSDTSGIIQVTPSTTVANISVSLTKTTIDVNTPTTATLTATDANGNPINQAVIVASEATNHGGTWDSTSYHTNISGITTADFTPSHFFVGADTLQFTSGSYTQTVAIAINPGALGRIYVDYAGTANGTMTGETIAAGTTVYVRGFLADTYGNPINASATTDVTYDTSGTTGKGIVLGTPVLTSDITEAQYPNQVKTAIGVALPYSVSTNLVNNPIILTAGGTYSRTVTIATRSNVPAKLVYTHQTIGAGNDSSVVVSNMGATTLSIIDSLADAYGNPVSDPGSVTIAPLRSSYAVYFSTNGLIKFKRTADTTAVDTVYPAGGLVNTKTILSGKKSGMDTVKTWAASSSSVSGATPIWVTPGTFAQLVITPAKDTTAVAGQTKNMTVEKQDTYGNHIDFGLSGGNLRSTYKASYNLAADTAGIVADTVSTGKNRGGYVFAAGAKTVLDSVGKAGVASVGGSFDMTFPFTTYADGVDTQKVYVKLGSIADTATIYSMATGGLKSFLATIAKADSVHNAGDSVLVTFTAQDSNGNRIYTYNKNGQYITLNHTNVSPNNTKDTTYYFSYVNTNGKYVKSIGTGLRDTVFNAGQAQVYLHKFHVDSINTVTISSMGVSATTAQGIRFKALPADTAYGKWIVNVQADSLLATGPFTFSVTPLDYYYNVTNIPSNIIVNITSNQTSGFNVGSNPHVVNGMSTFNGTLSAATDNLVIYVFNSDNSHILGTSASYKIFTGVEQEPSVPKVYSLDQNYPNPFNPSTTIKYELPKAGLVTLKVYDILGREVASLVNEKQAAGKYSVEFNADRLASGVYIYRIHAGDFVSVKKLMLLK